MTQYQVLVCGLELPAEADGVRDLAVKVFAMSIEETANMRSCEHGCGMRLRFTDRWMRRMAEKMIRVLEGADWPSLDDGVLKLLTDSWAAAFAADLPAPRVCPSCNTPRYHPYAGHFMPNAFADLVRAGLRYEMPFNAAWDLNDLGPRVESGEV